MSMLETANTPEIMIGRYWRPIAEAPKDGSEVLGFEERGYVGRRVVMRWDIRFDQWVSVPGSYGLHPSRWMPLPEPPK